MTNSNVYHDQFSMPAVFALAGSSSVRLRSRWMFFATVGVTAMLGACGGGGSGAGTPTIHLGTPDSLSVAAGAETHHCYYFRLANNEPMAIRKIEARIQNALNAVVFFTPGDVRPPGTVETGCSLATGFGASGYIAYMGQTPGNDIVFPVDDGAGKPVGKQVGANQSGILLIQTFNTGPDAVRPKFDLNLTFYPPGTVITRAETLTTFNVSIQIPPLTSVHVESRECSVPTGAQFFRMTTATFRQGTRARIIDGGSVVVNGSVPVETTDWEQPAVFSRNFPPFFTFASGKLTYECTYNNPYSRVILTGDRIAIDEKCEAFTYFFPATMAKTCVDNVAI